jgi:hypothetical protein
MGPGKPCAGKPHARFDEGRGADGHWFLCLSIRRFPPTLLHAALAGMQHWLVRPAGRTHLGVKVPCTPGKGKC